MLIWPSGVLSQQAPGDESPECVTGPAAQTYPDNWRVLMDSWNYLFLLDNDDAVWDQIDLDGNNANNLNTPTNVSTIETSL